MNDQEKQLFHRALEKLHTQFDPSHNMLKLPFSSPGYHTTLTGGEVHPIRQTLEYAVALYDAEMPSLEERATAVVDKVLSLQDTEPDSKTYGIWSWFLEEPLSMMAPPDWNWADFCGALLLEIVLDHGHRLHEELRSRVEAAIAHASRSIIRRNVGPEYTNIAIMGTFVTLAAGQHLQNPEFTEYGKERLRRFYKYTMGHDGFTEYNSPTYTVVAIRELGRILTYIQDPEDRKLVDELYYYAWRHLARHFHPPTGQWAGPHSRAYNTLANKGLISFLQRATRISFLDPQDLQLSVGDLRLQLPCPKGLVPYFSAIQEDFVVEHYAHSLVATTYHTENYTLGTINHGEMWNQRRNLLMYWGDQANPRYLHLRFLHDGYDYSSALFFSQQNRSKVLGGISFANNLGDTHIGLDRLKDGTIQATDLRLRFEFGGAVQDLQLPQSVATQETVAIQDGSLTISLKIQEACFGEEVVTCEIGEQNGTKYLDVVLYQGERRSINFNALTVAYITFALAVGQDEVNIAGTGGQCTWPEAGLALRVSPKPGTAQEVRRLVLQA